MYKKILQSAVPPFSMFYSYPKEDDKGRGSQNVAQEAVESIQEEEDIANPVEDNNRTSVIAALQALVGMDSIDDTGDSRSGIIIEEPSPSSAKRSSLLLNGKSGMLDKAEDSIDVERNEGEGESDDLRNFFEHSTLKYGSFEKEANLSGHGTPLSLEDKGDENNILSGKQAFKDQVSDLINFSNLEQCERPFNLNAESLTELERSTIQNADPLFIQETSLMRLKNLKLPRDNDLTKEERDRKYWIKYLIAHRLKSVMNLKDENHLYGNFNVWLIRDVIVQGHLYVTDDSILFFSFLPKVYEDVKSSDNIMNDDSYGIIQSGPLGMKSVSYAEAAFVTPLTHRFWAILRSETLSIYNSPTKLYFPTEVIDLKSCKSVAIVNTPKIDKPNSPTDSDSDTIESPASYDEDFILEGNSDSLLESVAITLTDDKKTYKFYCDSLFVATRWVNNISKILFQLHNSNAQNQVIFKIPIKNIISYSMDHMEQESSVDEMNVHSHSVSVLKHLEYVRDLQNDKEKHKKPDKVVEDTNLLFFERGYEFDSAIKDIFSKRNDFSATRNDNRSLEDLNYSEHVPKQHDTVFLNSILGEEQALDIQPTISTIQQEYSKALLNSILAESVFPYQKGSRDPVIDRFTHTTSELLNIKRLGRTISSSASILNSRPRSSSSATDINKTLKEAVVHDQIDFPRYMSYNNLRKTKMIFEASLKQLDHESQEIIKAIIDAGVHVETRSRSDTLIPRISLEELFHAEGLHKSSELLPNRNKPNSRLPLRSIGSYFKDLTTIYKKNAFNHYDPKDCTSEYYVSDRNSNERTRKHFQEHFSFNRDKPIIATYYCHVLKSIPVFGKLYLSESEICFRSLLPGVSTKMILPLGEILTVKNEKGFDIAYSGLVFKTTDRKEIRLEFYTSRSRNDCQSMLKRQIKELKNSSNFLTLSEENKSDVDKETRKLHSSIWEARIANARLKLFEDRLNLSLRLNVPIIIKRSIVYNVEAKTRSPLKFVFLTIGSRGDVQPYLALGKGLISEGHEVTIASHEEFGDWIKSRGIKFKRVAGNPAELMSIMVKHGTISVSFLKEASAKFKTWIVELLQTSWEACQDADILIESPSAMAGIHIAEALQIPYLRAFTMPWTRTRAYPHAFIVPDKKRGGSYNYFTHVLFETVFWKGISGQVNKWRVEALGLKRTNLIKLAQTKIPFLYNISPTIFPPSADFPDWVKVTGYWLLNEGQDGFSPDPALSKFIKTARDKGKKLIYIGFGSIVVKDAQKLSEAVVKGAVDADVYCILNKGWSDRLDSEKKESSMFEIPPEIYVSGNIPHDWLFKQVDLSIHHGGSGTTGACVMAGIPQIIKPFFGDQFFFASRVEELGIGFALKVLNSKSLTKAIISATSSEIMKDRAKAISKKVRYEDGVSAAIEQIYIQMEYARSLTIKRLNASKGTDSRNESSGTQTPTDTHGYESGIVSPMEGSPRCLKNLRLKHQDRDLTVSLSKIAKKLNLEAGLASSLLADRNFRQQDTENSADSYDEDDANRNHKDIQSYDLVHHNHKSRKGEGS